MKQYLFRLKFGCWRLYLANFRLKKMNPAGLRRTQHFCMELSMLKKQRYKQNGGTCELCGRKMNRADVQIHHILPYAEFPQYGLNPFNLEIVCIECHQAIHRNPYTNLQCMEKKAREFGFELTNYFK